jgi:uncharacterized integral membrane protein (TIGR00698 family)
MISIRSIFPGLILAIALALVATGLGMLLPVVGGPVFGIVLGIISGVLFGKPRNAAAGLGFASKQILQWAIIALGGGLSLTQVYRTGVSSLYVLIFTLSAAFITAYGFGRLLKIPSKMISLIGMGTAICGGSAIAAISPIIEAEDQEIAYAISTVFIFNVVAVLVFPPLGHLLGFSDRAFGLWTGTAVNDTSSVVAAGYAFSNAAGAYATIVKLTRSTMIIPISLIFSVIVSLRKKREAGGHSNAHYSFAKIFPWFIIGFLAASLLNTAGIITGQLKICLTELGKFMIVIALSAIGLNSDLKKMLKTGAKPVLLGLITWFSVALVSIMVQWITGQV